MLISAKDERARRFKLALRAGIPIILLIFLLFFTAFYKGSFSALTIENAFLMGGVVFITIYFIYFLLELDIKETLLDRTTDGFNHTAFLAKIREDSPKTVAILMINNLSTINENYGMIATNSMLQTLVSKLHQCIYIYQAKSGLIGRHSGAQFVIALDLESNQVHKTLERFIQKNQNIGSIEIDYRFAVISNSDENPETILSLLKDELSSQMIEERETKNQPKDAKKLSSLEKSVVVALESESLDLYFRPIHSIKKDKIDSYEVATKLVTQEGKGILPRDYLPIINRHGLGRSYDLLIFKKVIETALLVDDDINFSFNLSPFSLRDRDFLDSMFIILEDSDIDPQRLIVEIYERTAHHNLSNYLKTLSKIRAKGLRICIDNFGSSNASMEYMKHFKFDVVQFDREFVGRLDDENNLMIFKSLIDMARGLRITTVAKWVDNEAQKSTLGDLGIDYLQGFSIGRQLTERQLIKHFNS